MAHAARALRMGVMLGCMLESGLGIAAGCCVAPLCDHIDLDGNLLLREDPWPGVEFVDGSRCRRSSPASASPRVSRVRPMAERRILILGEGFSHDPHYGKTMRGIVRYGPDPVVAILDSKRAGEEHEGIPIVGTVEDAAPYAPTVAVVGVATQGGRFPPAWRELLKDVDRSRARRRERPARVHLGGPRVDRPRAAHGVELRDLRKPPAGLSVPTGANLEVDATIVLTVGSDCAIGKKTVAVELDLEARNRGLDSVFVPTGQTGIAIAGGDRRRRRRLGLPRRGGRVARRGGRAPGREAPVRRGPGLARAPALLGRHARARPRLRAARVLLCHAAGSTEIEGCPGHPIPPLRDLVELHERISLPARKAKVLCVAVNTAAIASDDEARKAIAVIAEETGLPADDPVRFGAQHLLDALLERL